MLFSFHDVRRVGDRISHLAQKTGLPELLKATLEWSPASMKAAKETRRLLEAAMKKANKETAREIAVILEDIL
jgi:hypothetical protein